ncbi:MAG: hypothetical protein GX442_24410 [Candidatus Riflebacteria bacterium]|nr:hypothetical protein [Candidatus Riflebacteria bacterium]
MPGRRAGLTLTEVLIALFLLTIAFTTALTVFRSATLESSFSSEHYTAMFLAQKIIEDAGAEIRHNPHAFSEFIARGEGVPEAVNGGGSRFFRLLDNTQNFGYLSETDDEPINEGPLFDQLKGFTAQVSTRFEEDPVTGEAHSDLVRITATIRWTARDGAAREYRLSQLFHGIPDESYRQPLAIDLSASQQATLDLQAKAYVADLLGLGGKSFDDLLKVYSQADPVVLMNLGRMGYLFNLGEQIEVECKKEIDDLEKLRDEIRDKTDLVNRLRYTDLQRKIAALYERKAVRQIASLLLVRKPVEEMIAALEADPPKAPTATSLTLTTLLEQEKYLRKIHATADKVFMTIRFIPMSLSSAESIYLTLVNPPYRDLIPNGLEHLYFRKALDIQKIGVLRRLDDAGANALLLQLRTNIGLFKDYFAGRFPHFLAFLDKEREYTGSLPMLREQYRSMYEVFVAIDTIDEMVNRVKELMPIPKKGKGKGKDED